MLCKRTGKRKFPTATDAQTVLAVISSQQRGDAYTVSVQQCQYCGQWHLVKRRKQVHE